MTEPAAQPAGSAGAPAAPRDRVLDAVKVVALGVVVGHAMAWDLTTGEPGSILDREPSLAWVTWLVQVLPLFFAVGGAANRLSWRRRPEPAAFLRRRVLRLGAPVLVFATVWTALLLPLAASFPVARLAGSYLAGLAWFVGVYAAVVVAVPWTSRWAGRPVAALGGWLAAIVVVDVLRFTTAPAVGWLNVLLVWGWVHQVGFHLAELRRWPARRLLALAAGTLALALALAVPGPYAATLVTYAADATSNFTPPTVVLALVGLAQVLVLAAASPWLGRALARDAVWRVTRALAGRAVDLYLWHIPWVAAVAAAAWLADFRPHPLDGAWWLAHAAGLVVVLAGTWATASLAVRADRAVASWLARGRRRRPLPALPAALLATFALLLSSGTGYATWWGPTLVGVPSSSLLAWLLLVGSLRALAVAGPAAPARPSRGYAPHREPGYAPHTERSG